jgi:outer membrane lipoprotein-sorting protein
MKYIKFHISNDVNITLPAEKAKRVMESPEKIVMINDDQGNWTGLSINKSFIMLTEEDLEYTRAKEREERQFKKLNHKNAKNLLEKNEN